MDIRIKGLVSIVVPTHGNRDLSLLKNSVEGSLYKNVELIVVNRNQERSEQRNFGIDLAKGEFLLWLDSDQSISPMLLTECVQMMNWYEYCNGLYVPEVIVAKSFFGKIRKFEREFYTGTAIDCVRFVRMSVCPRFNLELKGPEDADFDKRVPHRKMVTKNVLYHHDDIQPLEYIKKKSYYGKSMKKYAELWPDDPCLNIKYRIWTVFTENGKYKKIIRHPVLSLGIFILLIVRGFIYANR
jgi:glycosyltransferase involved in cell wall biosynthesis